MSIGPQTDWQDLDNAKSAIPQQPHDFAECKMVQCKPTPAFCTWYRSIAGLVFIELRPQPIPHQPATSAAIPAIKPIVVNVDDERAAGPQQTAHVLDDTPTFRRA